VVTVYATPADVRTILTNDDSDTTGTAAGMVDSKLQVEIDAAQAEIDARLANRYQTPFAAVPPLVHSICVDIAAYRANLLYRKSQDLTSEDPMVLRYTNAQALLGLLASGAADLPGVGSGDGNSTAGTATVRNQYVGKLFSPDDLGLGYASTRRGWRGW
jgi:phage gp36-like protein